MNKTDVITVKSQAKVNLTFDILKTMPDGYHEVSTLMQAIDLGDYLSYMIKPASAFHVDLDAGKSKNELFPIDDTNLIYKAAKLFCEHLGKEPFKIEVQVDKQIPIAAGLAGGSSNAAATLLALNEYFGRPFDRSSLQHLGRQLGADVPFCISGGIAVGQGRGDIIQPVESQTDFIFCLVKPKDIALSTPWVYKQYDLYVSEKGLDSIRRPNLENAVGAISFGDLEAAIESFGNVFEPVVYDRCPQLLELRELLIGYKCPYVQLTGSGPTIFALVSDLEMAHFVRSKLMADKIADKLDIFIASSAKTQPRID